MHNFYYALLYRKITLKNCYKRQNLGTPFMTRVARYHADRTNQKLYFARLSCQQAEQIDHVQQAQAYREAAVFHLHGAVLAFLQELVRYYRLNDLNPTLKSIEEHMAAKGQVSPEVTVMQQLSKEGFIARVKTCLSLVSVCARAEYT